jgi:FMN phosphatase YigB (HAD superfamily)
VTGDATLGLTVEAIVFDIGDTLVRAAAPGTPVDELRARPIGAAVAELRALAPGHRIGAVTDTSVMREADVRAALAGTGLNELLEVIVTSTDVGAAKPDPRGLLQALRQLGVAPERALFVGDADVDEGAARAAGTWFARSTPDLSPGHAIRAFLAGHAAASPTAAALAGLLAEVASTFDSAAATDEDAP